MFTFNDHISIEMVGGKAFRLQQMFCAQLCVPHTIIISIEEVAMVIADQRVPQYILDRIEATLSFYNGGVAVRSSGFGEDSGILSWAGQFTSILHVSREGLASAILECANAQQSDSVMAYARHHNAEIPPLALIVQEMVDAQFAGVLFTFDPMTGDDHVLIELVAGHGEVFVSGMKSGDRIAVDPVSREIIFHEGTVHDLPYGLIDSLVDLGLRGKELFGRDQDMEFAYEEATGLLYALQSRDITTEQPRKVDYNELRAKVISETKRDIAAELVRLDSVCLRVTSDVFSDQNIAEILTLNPTPMTLGLFNYVFAHGDGAIRTARNEMGYEIGAELDEGFFTFVGAQPRCSIVHDACTYRIKGIPLEDYAVIVNGYIDAMIVDPKLANYPEVVLYDQNPTLNKLVGLFGEEKGRRYRAAYDAFHENLHIVMETTDKDCRERFIPEWQSAIGKEVCVEAVNVKDLVAQYYRLAEMLRTKGCSMFVKVARLGFFAFATLRNILIELFGEDGERYVNVLTSGTDLELNPNLKFAIELAKLKKGETTVHDIVSVFGHLSVHELEVGTPRYHECPEMIKMFANRIADDPMEDYRATISASETLYVEVLRKAGDRARELGCAIRAARLYLPLREVVKFEYLRAYDIMRQNMIKVGQLLGWEGDLVFYLNPREFFTLNTECDQLYSVAQARKVDHESQRALFVPSVIFSDNLETIGILPESDGLGLFRGLGVTNVSVTGEVVVMCSLDDAEALASLRPGCVLVTKTTDPAWSPILSIVGSGGGLITEVGGLLAHGAIYAREVGLAAVLNIPGITDTLETGMKVYVNGSNGTVTILR